MGILQKNKNKIKTKIQNIRTVQCEYSSNKKKPIKEKKEKKKKYCHETLTEDTNLRLMIKVSVLFSKKNQKKSKNKTKKSSFQKKTKKIQNKTKKSPSSKKIKKKFKIKTPKIAQYSAIPPKKNKKEKNQNENKIPNKKETRSNMTQNRWS